MHYQSVNGIQWIETMTGVKSLQHKIMNFHSIIKNQRTESEADCTNSGQHQSYNSTDDSTPYHQPAQMLPDH